jgi:hypothetical protein
MIREFDSRQKRRPRHFGVGATPVSARSSWGQGGRVKSDAQLFDAIRSDAQHKNAVTFRVQQQHRWAIELT